MSKGSDRLQKTLRICMIGDKINDKKNQMFADKIEKYYYDRENNKK